MASWSNFACPNCLRTEFKPWSAVWCACDPSYTPQGYEPEPSWTRMVKVSTDQIKGLLDTMKEEEK